MMEITSGYSIPVSRQVAIVANMTALALLGNYALVGIPNVELGTVIIFLTALVFGSAMGIWCAASTSIIYSMFNPWGPFIPQIWLTQFIAWIYVSLVGGVMSQKFTGQNYQSVTRIEMAIVGAFIAAVFDLITNIGYSLVFNVPYILAVVLGLPFMLIHIVSNAIIMAIVVPSVEPILKRDLGSMIWNIPNAEQSTESLLEEGI
jgi:hypothetical protein